jgi:hypothetical protein
MSDITATVLTNELITTQVDTIGNPIVYAVGIQGASASSSSISGLGDVDALLPANGSVLVYKTITSKWTATTTLDAQNMEGGEF